MLLSLSCYLGVAVLELPSGESGVGVSEWELWIVSYKLGVEERVLQGRSHEVGVAGWDLSHVSDGVEVAGQKSQGGSCKVGWRHFNVGVADWELRIGSGSLGVEVDEWE